MQVKIFTIPVPGGEVATEEMNQFLRSRKILQVDNHLVSQPSGAFMVFTIKFLEDSTGSEREKVKIDYREVLDGPTFARFAKMREIRKALAAEEGVPTYVVFLDEELAALAKMDEVSANTMKGVKGIGEKKMEKYGRRFLEKWANHEKGEQPH